MSQPQSLAYAGKTPWQSIGNPLPPGQSIDTWTRSAGIGLVPLLHTRALQGRGQRHARRDHSTTSSALPQCREGGAVAERGDGVGQLRAAGTQRSPTRQRVVRARRTAKGTGAG